jgi:hypothetical protein
MAWVTCPHCGFTQIPSARCLKCHKSFDRPPAPGSAVPAGATSADRASLGALLSSVPRPWVAAFAGLAVAVIVGVLLWSRGAAPSADAAEPAPLMTPEPWTVDLTGRWQGRADTTVGDPPRPALREAFIETDRSGAIVAAGAVLTDPGHGGAGAGYLTVPDGGRRVREIAAALAASPHGAALALDFIPLPPWIPKRERQWRALEGQHGRPEDTSYLLLESVEPGYLIQAGVNASGFLSYLFLSPEYASGRGEDALSRVIHPGRGDSLRGFRGLVWDLSGAANFVSFQVPVTISQPAGAADRIVLKREDSGRSKNAGAGPGASAANP